MSDAKSSIFSKMKKSIFSDDAEESGDLAAGSEEVSASVPRGRQAPTDEDMQIIMDQLSTLSQQLADVHMEKAALESEKVDLEKQNKEMEEEHETLVQNAKDWEAKYEQIQRGVSYQKVEEGVIELQKAKAELAKQTEETESLRAAQHQLVEDLELTKTQATELTQQLVQVTKEYVTLQESSEQAQRYTDDLLDQLLKSKAELENKQAEWEAEMQDLNRQMRELRKHQELERETMMKTLATQAAQTQDEQARVVAERNNFKRKAESLKKDMAKILSSEKKKAEENVRLKEELERKSKSLMNAMEALSMQIEDPSAGGSNISSQPHPPSTLPVASIQTKQYHSSPSEPLNSNVVLEDHVRALTSLLEEKEVLLSGLREANIVMGKQIMELEAKLGTGGAAKEAARKAERKRRNTGINGVVSSMFDNDADEHGDFSGISSGGVINNIHDIDDNTDVVKRTSRIPPNSLSSVSSSSQLAYNSDSLHEEEINDSGDGDEDGELP